MDVQTVKLKNKHVVYRCYTGRSGSGSKNFKPDVTLHVILFGKLNTIYTANGQQLTTSYVIYIDGLDLQSMSNDDIFVVNGLVIPVAKTEPFYNIDETVNYWEVFI